MPARLPRREDLARGTAWGCAGWQKLRGITDGFNLGCDFPDKPFSPFKLFQSHPWESCGRAREVN